MVGHHFGATIFICDIKLQLMIVRDLIVVETLAVAFADKLRTGIVFFHQTGNAAVPKINELLRKCIAHMHEVNLIGRKERCSVQITDLNATLLKVVCMLGAVGIDRIPEDPICIFLADGSDVLQLFCRIILAVENEYAVAVLLRSVNDRTDKLICFSGITEQHGEQKGLRLRRALDHTIRRIVIFLYNPEHTFPCFGIDALIFIVNNLGYRRSRHTGQLCNFINCHGKLLCKMVCYCKRSTSEIE